MIDGINIKIVMFVEYHNQTSIATNFSYNSYKIWQ